MVLLTVCTSCVNSLFYKDYAVRVDSLNASLEASASSFEQIDTVRIRNQSKQVEINLDTLFMLQKEIVHGTINDYSYIKKSYKTILREYPLAMKELQYCRNQITDLKHDIEHRHLDEQMIKNYFSQEEEAISMLKYKMEKLSEMAEKQTERFSQLNPQIELMIDSLSTQK